MSDPLWQDVPAVKNNRVFLMPTSFVSYDRFAVELPLMMDYTANLLYPNQLLYQLSYTSLYEGRHFCRNLFVKILPYGQSATC